MSDWRGCRILLVSLAGLGLSGCVAAVPVQPTLTVIPGKDKTEANLRADDAACRSPRASGPAASTAAGSASQAPITADQYYACMASRGEDVVQQQPRPYAYAAPVYAPYAYPAIAAYPYPYPYYGYPYGPAYFGPYVGFGFGFRYGGFYGRYGYGFHGGYHG